MVTSGFAGRRGFFAPMQVRKNRADNFRKRQRGGAAGEPLHKRRAGCARYGLRGVASA